MCTPRVETPVDCVIADDSTAKVRFSVVMSKKRRKNMSVIAKKLPDSLS
jgi:hypothetical protein